MAQSPQKVIALSLALLAVASATEPARTSAPFTLGSGLKLQFEAQSGASYCLISDPCLHVNALLDSAPAPAPLSWVHGLGIRSGKHSLILRTRAPEPAPRILPGAYDSSYRQRDDTLALAMLDYTDVTANLSTGLSVRSDDGALEVGVVEAGALYLVSLVECRVRLLVRVHTTTRAAAPSVSSSSPSAPALSVLHFQVDALDWQNLDSPHGIIGQMFPNHAEPRVFSTALGQQQQQQEQQQQQQPQQQLVAARELPVTGQSLKDALEELRALASKATVLDGIPEDYRASGLLEPDCIFSRFTRSTSKPVASAGNEAMDVEDDEEGTAAFITDDDAPDFPVEAKEQRIVESHGEVEGDEDEEDMEASEHTQAHIARSTAAESLAASIAAAAAATGDWDPTPVELPLPAQSRLGHLRGAATYASVSQPSVERLLEDSPRTADAEQLEAAHGQGEVIDGASDEAVVEKELKPEGKGTITSRPLTNEEIELIASTQGTVEEGPAVKALGGQAQLQAPSKELGRWRKWLSQEDMKNIESTHGTSEGGEEGAALAGPSAGSFFKALSQMGLQALTSLGGSTAAVVDARTEELPAASASTPLKGSSLSEEEMALQILEKTP